MMKLMTTGVLQTADEIEAEKALEKPQKSRTKRRPPLTEKQQNLAKAYLPMAKGLAKPLKESWPMERDEFDSAALLALVQAAQSYDPSKKVKFSTFARYRIWGALRDVQRTLIRTGWRRDMENAPIIGSLPFDAEEFGTVIGCQPDRRVGAELEATDFVENCLSKLPEKHAEACRLIYILGKTQGEAAEAMGCSKSRLSTLHQQALELINESWTYKASLEARSENLTNR